MLYLSRHRYGLLSYLSFPLSIFFFRIHLLLRSNVLDFSSKQAWRQGRSTKLLHLFFFFFTGKEKVFPLKSSLGRLSLVHFSSLPPLNPKKSLSSSSLLLPGGRHNIVWFFLWTSSHPYYTKTHSKESGVPSSSDASSRRQVGEWDRRTTTRRS